MARAKILTDIELEDAELDDILRVMARQTSRRRLNELREQAYELLDAARAEGRQFSIKELTA